MGSLFPTAFAGFFLPFYLISISVSVVFYVLHSIGLMNMLKSCGFNRLWYAWVPLTRSYAVGWLADMYDNGKAPTNYAKRLLGLNIAVCSLAVIIIPLTVIFFVINNITLDTTPEQVQFISLFIIVFLLLEILYAIAIVYTVFSIIAIWRIYRIFAPEMAIGLLFLSIFVSASSNIIFFVLRNRVPQKLRGRYAPPPPPNQQYQNPYHY